MSQQRGTSTDQLINVIQVIQLGRKTGRLLAEREEVSWREVGEIRFVRGHITDAYCGQMQGQSALNWLQNWGVCRFIFTPTGEDQLGQQADFSSSASSKRFVLEQTFKPSMMPPAGNELQAYSIPQRIHTADVGLSLLTQAGLSRQHRHLFLLIDGHRTTGELTRLMGQTLENILRHLQDLEALGIIRQ